MGNITSKTADKWFLAHGILTSIFDGRLYIIHGDGFEFELTDEEVRYRADLWIQSQRQNKIHNGDNKKDDFYNMVDYLVDIARNITDKYKKK